MRKDWEGGKNPHGKDQGEGLGAQAYSSGQGSPGELVLLLPSRKQVHDWSLAGGDFCPDPCLTVGQGANLNL